jgi:hypothetical protein
MIMKLTKIIAPLFLSLSAVVLSTASHAESQYGYSDTGAGVTAQSSVKVTVKVPSLILLRVGTADTTQNELIFTSNPTIPAGGVVPANGNNTVVNWDGTAPAFATTNTGDVVRAFSWTNASAGGKVTCAVTTPFPAASGLLASHVTVTNAAVAGAGATLNHPGGDTTCSGTTNFTRNTIASSDWQFAITAAGMAAAAPGSNSEIITYTATTL